MPVRRSIANYLCDSPHQLRSRITSTTDGAVNWIEGQEQEHASVVLVLIPASISVESAADEQGNYSNGVKSKEVRFAMPHSFPSPWIKQDGAFSCAGG